MVLKYKIFESRSKKIKENSITKSFIINLLKEYKLTMKYYIPTLSDMSIKIIIEGDKSNYDKMLNRLLSIKYKDIINIDTVKYGEIFKIFIKH